MKQSIFVKIGLILTIIVIACCIKTTISLATDDWNSIGGINSIISDLNNDGSKKYMTHSILKTSPYVFCRERGTSLYENSIYTKDPDEIPNPKKYPIVTINDGIATVEGADIAYILSSDIQRYPKREAAYGAIQQAYWATLDNVYEDASNKNRTPLSSLNSEELKLYYEAQAYKEYRKEIEQFKIDHNQDKYEPIINTENTKTEFIDNNKVRVGPFSVDYARYWDAVNEIPFGTITLNFTKEKYGNPLTADDLKTNNEATTTEAIVFDYKNKKNEWVNGIPACVRQVEIYNDEDDSSTMNVRTIFTNTANIVADFEFYITIDLSQFNDYLSVLYLNVSTGVVERSAEVYFITGKYEVTGRKGVYYCVDCANLPITWSGKNDKDQDVTYSGNYLTSGTRRTTYYGSKPAGRCSPVL